MPEMDLGTQEIVLDHSAQISQTRYLNENVRKLCADIDVVHFSGEDLHSLFDSKLMISMMISQNDQSIYLNTLALVAVKKNMQSMTGCGYCC